MKKARKPRNSAAPASAASLRQDGRRPRGKLSKRPDEARGGAPAPPRLGGLRRRLRPDSMALGLSTLLACPKTRKSKRAKKERRDRRDSAHGRSGRSLGPKPRGGEVFRFVRRAFPQKNSSNRSPKGPNNPTRPASPTLPTRQTDQTNPTDPTNPTGLNTARQTEPAPATPDGALRPRTTHQKTDVGRGAGLGRTRFATLTAERASAEPSRRGASIEHPASNQPPGLDMERLCNLRPRSARRRARLRPTNRIAKAWIGFPFV